MEYMAEAAMSLWLGMPLWVWLAFIGVVLLLLVFDLGVMHRKTHEIGVRESIWMSGLYIGLGLMWAVAVWWIYATYENAGAVEFYSGHRPVLLDAARSVLGIGATFADAAGTFWSAPRFAEAWASARPPYLLTTREPAQSIVASLPPRSARLLFAHNGRWLYDRAPADAGPGSR